MRSYLDEDINAGVDGGVSSMVGQEQGIDSVVKKQSGPTYAAAPGAAEAYGVIRPKSGIENIGGSLLRGFFNTAAPTIAGGVTGGRAGAYKGMMTGFDNTQKMEEIDAATSSSARNKVYEDKDLMTAYTRAVSEYNAFNGKKDFQQLLAQHLGEVKRTANPSMWSMYYDAALDPNSIAAQAVAEREAHERQVAGIRAPLKDIDTTTRTRIVNPETGETPTKEQIEAGDLPLEKQVESTRVGAGKNKKQDKKQPGKKTDLSKFNKG